MSGDGARKRTRRLARPVTTDGGWGWMVLVGAFVAYFIADGWSCSFGVFFPVFLRNFQASRGYTAVIGAMMHGVPRLFSPFVCAIINAVGCRTVAICGGIIIAVSFMMSAFATSIDYLCVTIGLMASMGFATIYISSLVIVTFYFDKRRGLATGLATTGSGLGAFIFPPLMELCMDTFSWRGTLILVSGICLHFIAAGALFRPPEFKEEEPPPDEDIDDYTEYCQISAKPFPENPELRLTEWKSIASISSWSVKPQSSSHRNDCHLQPEHDPSDYTSFVARSITEALDCVHAGNESPQSASCPTLNTPPESPKRGSLSKEEALPIYKTICRDLSRHFSQICDRQLCTNRQYVVFLLASFIFYLFIIVPYVYLVDMVSLLGYSDNESALLLSIIGIGRTLGQVVLGCLGDIPKVNSMLVYSVAIATSGVATALIPVSAQYMMLCFSCALFGFAVSCTYVLQMICVVKMVGLERSTNAFGIFQMVPGIATLIGTPLAGLLYEAQGNYEMSFYLAGALVFVSGGILLLIPFLKRPEQRKEDTVISA